MKRLLILILVELTIGTAGLLLFIDHAINQQLQQYKPCPAWLTANPQDGCRQ